MNTIKSDKERIASLNLLRGIAALSVFCFHIFHSGFDAIPWLKTIFSYGYLGLDLFFIISGFIIPYSMYQNNYQLNKFPKFLLKRSIRIEPPYIISFLLIVLMRIMHLQIHNWQFPNDNWGYTHDWKQFWLHFLYLNQYFGIESYTVVYWTLAIEFQFYLLIGFLYPLLVHSKKNISFITGVVFCTLVWFLNLNYNWFIFQYGYLFVTGVLLFLYTIEHISFKWFLVLFGVILYLLYYKNGLDVVLTSVFAVIAITTIKKKWKLTNFLGQISYSFYLVHLEAAGWFMLYTRDAITNDTVLRIIAFLFAISFAIGFYFLFERPSFKLSKRIRY